MKRKISVAPMMDWTTKYCRVFHRAISSEVYLYTEMVTTGAILYGHRARFLDFFPAEHPIALQLGGSDPKDLAECAKLAEEWGYDEVNLNVGCPSDRVQAGKIGACLMAEPDLVARCYVAMTESVSIPISIKSRIGIDDLDSWEHFESFVEKIYHQGCRDLIVHARKAWLTGLSPKENRNVPPLKYDWVHKIKQLFPDMDISINGGVANHEDITQQLAYVDGVMIGREAYGNPWLLNEVDARYYGKTQNSLSREDVLRSLYPFWESELSKGVPLQRMVRHCMGLFHGIRGGRQFRRIISEKAPKKGAGLEVIEEALRAVAV